MKKFSLFQAKDQKAAFLFALFSQSIWLPVFIDGHHDHKLASSNKGSLSKSYLSGSAKNIYSLPSLSHPTSSYGSSSDKGQSTNQQSTGLVLHSALSPQQVSPRSLSRSLVTRNSFSAFGRSFSHGGSTSLLSKLSSSESDGSKSSVPTNLLIKKQISPLQHLYTRSELLGGILTLDNMNEPLMPAIVRAERAQWIRSGDPLAPLPDLWREPMRRALTSLLNSESQSTLSPARRDQSVLTIESARIVHVPSSRVRRSSEIPLALQPDGSVDILNKPDDPAVIEEINRWSQRQRLPQKGRITAAVIHLHPFVPESSHRTAPTTTPLQPQNQPRPSAVTPPKPSAPVEETVPAPSPTQPLTQAPSSPALAPEPSVLPAPPPSPAPAPSAALAPAAVTPVPAVSPQPVSEGHATAPTEAES